MDFCCKSRTKGKFLFFDLRFNFFDMKSKSKFYNFYVCCNIRLLKNYKFRKKIIFLTPESKGLKTGKIFIFVAKLAQKEKQ